MNKYSLVFILIFVLTIFIGIISERVIAKKEADIYTFDLTYTNNWNTGIRKKREQIYDHVMLATSLQGLVNSEAPRLYLKYVHERGGKQRNLDEYWLDIIRNELNW